MLYNQGWLRSEQNFHHAIPREVQEAFSPALRDLIGHTGDNPMKSSWYTGPVYGQPYLGSPLPPGSDTQVFQSGYRGSSQVKTVP